ncbi:hypothetical protein JYT72_03165 [Crocinitomix catalasitica]|nr:hypothetical protein [Crocinitomix catalasitica]
MLDTLSNTSRIWIFQSNRSLSELEENFISEKFNEFIPQWAAHGNELFGEFHIAKSHFLLVGVDEDRNPASGCSVDKLTHKVEEIGRELEIDFLNRLTVAYEKDGQIVLVTMEEFKTLVRAGEVNADTTVYNNLIPTKGELEMGWRTSVSNSWHKNLLEIA